MSELVVF